MAKSKEKAIVAYILDVRSVDIILFSWSFFYLDICKNV